MTVSADRIHPPIPVLRAALDLTLTLGGRFAPDEAHAAVARFQAATDPGGISMDDVRRGQYWLIQTLADMLFAQKAWRAPEANPEVAVDWVHDKMHDHPWTGPHIGWFDQTVGFAMECAIPGDEGDAVRRLDTEPYEPTSQNESMFLTYGAWFISILIDTAEGKTGAAHRILTVVLDEVEKDGGW